MLIQFSVTNYRAIADTQTFSMVASNLSDSVDNLIDLVGESKIKLLRTSAIYGANASGKSTFINSMETMAEIVIGSVDLRSANEYLSIKPFGLDIKYKDIPTEFEVILYINEVKYQFGFSFIHNKIKDEWLYSFPHNRSRTLYERSWNDKTNEYEWYMGNELKGEKNTWLKSTRDNALFLSTAVLLNSEQLYPLHYWFNKKLKTSGIGGWSEKYTASVCFNESKEDILNILKAGDVGIDDLNVDQVKFDPDEVPTDLPSEVRDFIIFQSKGKNGYDVKTIHKDNDNNVVEFNMNDESDGTRKLFALAGPWVDSLKNGNVLFIDELNNSLHPLLVKFLVELFNNKKTNPNNAQLVFTTHETSILKQDIFRRDQIWFCEKDHLKKTSIYPLSEFRVRKNFEDLEASYLSGKFGALPFIKMTESL